jgi:hypothetical protein
MPVEKVQTAIRITFCKVTLLMLLSATNRGKKTYLRFPSICPPSAELNTKNLLLYSGLKPVLVAEERNGEIYGPQRRDNRWLEKNWEVMNVKICTVHQKY